MTQRNIKFYINFNVENSNVSYALDFEIKYLKNFL